MPQQVEKNREDIELIKKTIDGLDAEDNVVVVPDMSHILSADELKSVRQPVAFIVYDNQLFIKKKEENGNAYFNLVFSIAVSIVVSFESKQIEVNLTNGALGITLATVDTYSVSQIDNKFATLAYVDSALASKASLSGANFTGPISAPSIIENMVGYSASFSSSDANTRITPNYIAACKQGNMLVIVAACRITKIGSSDERRIAEFTLPQSVADRLIPDTLGAYSILDVQELPAFASVFSAVKIPARTLKLSGGLRVGINIDTTNLVQNTEYYIRYSTIFLLNDNLAQ